MEMERSVFGETAFTLTHVPELNGGSGRDCGREGKGERERGKGKGELHI